MGEDTMSESVFFPYTFPGQARTSTSCEVRCDGCAISLRSSSHEGPSVDWQLTDAAAREDARQRATAAGWKRAGVVAGVARDLCPQCQEKP